MTSVSIDTFEHPNDVPRIVSVVQATNAMVRLRPSNVDEITLHAHGASFPVLEAGSGVPVILVHGLGHDLSDWAPLFSHRPAGVRLLAFDLPGFGLAAHTPVPTTMALLSEALRAVIAHVGEPPVVVGSSLGGHVALLVALQNPGAVRGLVLAAPGGLHTVSSTTASLARAYYSEASINARSDEEILRNSRRIFADPTSAAALRLAARKLAVHRSPLRSVFARSFASVVGDVFRHPVTTRFAQITTPSLIVYGEKDAVVERGPLVQAIASTTRSRFVGFDGVGHLPMVEAAERFADVTFAFATACFEKEPGRVDDKSASNDAMQGDAP